MAEQELQKRLTSLKPYTFYGDAPPRRLSKDPSKILQPLLEWAEKAHVRKGGLAGRKLRHHMPPPPKRPSNAYKLFFEDSKEKLLAKGGKFTRDEIQTVAPTIKQMWLDASAETLRRFQALAKQDAERYNSEIRAYEHAYPEFARQLKIQAHQRKARLRRAKELKKGDRAALETPSGTPRRRRTTTATNKVSKWLNQLSESDLATTETTNTSRHKGSDSSSESDSETSSAEDSDDADGYAGAYRLP